MNNKFKLPIIIMLVFIINSMHAQHLTQTIRGRIVDEDSKTPLIGVNVILIGSNPLRGTATDINGDFRLDLVALGRTDLQIRYLGYEEKLIPNVLVSSGKEVILDVELKESVVKMDEVVVMAQKQKGEVLNEMAIISSRSFSVDETKRYAGAIQDPSRMVSVL
ncbi:MAG: carboxypeptidase-like regulatory domain-containing protein [Bacteroidetes bacterium]|nr:carboxypeptidase-like regulatory domain-containing protein [Bacteroidota bacterium]